MVIARTQTSTRTEQQTAQPPMAPRGEDQPVRRQAPDRVILVRPHQFTPNPWTATDNAFQSVPDQDGDQVAQRAFEETTALAETLTSLGVGVSIFEDPSQETPDSVFPNNWLSTHEDGTVVVYPMYAPNRRAERRTDVLSHLRETGRVRRIIDYSPSEHEDEYLEGTGAMVLDNIGRLAFACRSHLISPRLFSWFCRDLGYEPLLFDAVDSHGIPVYHTNVLMAVGTTVAVVGAELIRDEEQRRNVVGSLVDSGREVVEITEEQVNHFAGNCMEVMSAKGPALILSATAHACLRPEQRAALERHASLHPVDVSTIESAGGSVRCMMAGDLLPERGWVPLLG